MKYGKQILKIHRAGMFGEMDYQLAMSTEDQTKD